MAGCRRRLRKLYDRIPDWLWPHLAGEPIPAPNQQREIQAIDEELLGAMEHAVEQRLEQVDERLRSVESKLQALLALTSILAAAATAGFAAASSLPIPEGYAKIPVWVGLIVILYATLNLLRSVWSTVSGLRRRSFQRVSYNDLVTRVEEEEAAAASYRARILQLNLGNAEWNDWVVNQKVSEMAVAHVALRNALMATGGIILMAAALVLFRLL